MEDMARLALVEESVRDIDKLKKILYELLRHINHILENPHDYQLRTIKSNVLKEAMKFESFNEYLKYIGFAVADDKFVYPKKSMLSNLRMAQVAIERKINFCFGSIDNNQKRLKTAQSQPMLSKNLKVIKNVLSTKNSFLLKIQKFFNSMLIYEDPELQALAREQVPIVTLQLQALDRVREQQMELKTGKIKGHDLPFDIALLMELLHWFKNKFFKWVDKPACEDCGGPTVYVNAGSLTYSKETCRVELYKCTRCPGTARFPRYNDPSTLLRTRRGRCGEWANCFTLICRSLGYDTRYVYDTTDHVWCEVFDFDSNTWLHVDPCECKLDAPLLYSHGWGKKLCYVIAFSRDDLQDVTWRYTMHHKEVLKRRTACTESELIHAIMALRTARLSQVSEARRNYLHKRTALELVQLMVEKTPSEYESEGRVSGSAAWRRERCEGGAGHCFQLRRPHEYTIRYFSSLDRYQFLSGGAELRVPKGWAGGALAAANILRKVEQDWDKVYLARADSAAIGTLSWRMACESGLRGASLSVRARTAQFNNGRVRWTIAFDDQKPEHAQISDTPTHFSRRFSSVTVTAELSGGTGNVAWQHAQLFRQQTTDKSCAFEIIALVEAEQ